MSKDSNMVHTFNKGHLYNTSFDIDFVSRKLKAIEEVRKHPSLFNIIKEVQNDETRTDKPV